MKNLAIFSVAVFAVLTYLTNSGKTAKYAAWFEGGGVG
jgi:hypothetical protein